MLLSLPAIGHAEGIACGNETVIVTDGRIVQSTIPASTTFWFIFDGTVGRSYSIEIKDPVDPYGASPGTLTVYGPSSCSTVITTRNTYLILPTIIGTGSRVSFTATGARIRFTVANSVASPRPYTVSVSETTQSNPRWSTIGGYTSQWGFHNTTNATISGNLRVYTTAGTQVANTTFSVSSGRVVFQSSTGLAIAADQSGNATFTHDGPPGAIQADAYMISADVTTVVPTKFEPVREAAH
jgi:hypothetical protein